MLLSNPCQEVEMLHWQDISFKLHAITSPSKTEGFKVIDQTQKIFWNYVNIPKGKSLQRSLVLISSKNMENWPRYEGLNI